MNPPTPSPFTSVSSIHLIAWDSKYFLVSRVESSNKCSSCAVFDMTLLMLTKDAFRSRFHVPYYAHMVLSLKLFGLLLFWEHGASLLSICFNTQSSFNRCYQPVSCSGTVLFEDCYRMVQKNKSPASLQVRGE